MNTEGTKTRKKILLVDSELEELSWLKQLFHEKGFDLLTAPDCATARQLAATALPSLILINCGDDKLRALFNFGTQAQSGFTGGKVHLRT